MKFLALRAEKHKLRSWKKNNPRLRKTRLRSPMSMNPSPPPAASSKQHLTPPRLTLRSLWVNWPKSQTQERWLNLIQNWLPTTETSFSSLINLSSLIPIRRSQSTKSKKAKMIWVPSKWKEALKWLLEMKMNQKLKEMIGMMVFFPTLK